MISNEIINDILQQCFASCMESDCDHDDCVGASCKQMTYYKTGFYRGKLLELLKQGAVINRQDIDKYKYLDSNGYYAGKIFKLIEDFENSKSEEIEEEVKCKHVWVPAGSRKNKDRTHNSGKGKYMAYKCEICDKFKKRYFN